VVAGSLKLTVDSAVTESIAVAGAPPSDDRADECSDPGADGYSLIRMLMREFIGGLRVFDERTHVMAGCVCVFVHDLLPSLFIGGMSIARVGAGGWTMSRKTLSSNARVAISRTRTELNAWGSFYLYVLLN
jgi:hypothetical protein